MALMIILMSMTLMVIVPQFVVIMTLMVMTVAAAVMVLLGCGISNPLSDDKSHMMQSVASNTVKITCAFHIEGKQPCRGR